MKQFAKCLPYEIGETFPYVRLDGKKGMHPCDDVIYDQWMPESIEDDEFNMLILLDGEMVKVRSCHFDFVFDSIEIVWTLQDIYGVDDSLDDEQCLNVLQYLEQKHDCNFGITWETIESAIHQLKET